MGYWEDEEKQWAESQAWYEQQTKQKQQDALNSPYDTQMYQP
jgi:hypothetical protein